MRIFTFLFVLTSMIFATKSKSCELNVNLIEQVGCNTYIFQASAFDEGAQIHWTLNGNDYNIGTITTFQFQNGINHICAFYETPDCPNGAEWCETFNINCNDDCELNAVAISIDSYMEWGGPSFAAWSLVDEFGMSTANGMAQFSNNDPYYDELLCVPNGCYTLVLQYNGLVNPENFNVFVNLEGLPLSFELITQPGYSATTILDINGDCGIMEECPQELWSNQIDDQCNYWAFEIGGFQPGEQAVWYFGDGTIEPGGHYATHLFPEPGEYEVCVYYTSELCLATEVCITVVVEDCAQENCNLDVQILQSECDVLVLQALGAPNNAQIHWNVDGQQYNIGNITTFVLDNGPHQICAAYETPECPDGVYWCETFTFGCEEECEFMSFYITSIIQLGGPAFVEWNILNENNQSVEEGIAQFSEMETTTGALVCLPPGCYNLVIYYDGEVNPQYLSAQIYMGGLEIEVESSYNNGFLEIGPIAIGNAECGEQNNCSDDLYAAHQENCLNWVFEIGGFQPGEIAQWNFGDGSFVTGGHFIEHNFYEPGVYEVCVTYQSELCDGITVCTAITVSEDCNVECHEIDFQISYFGEQPSMMEWVIHPHGGDEVLETGGLEFNPFFPTDAGGACLPDGCYDLMLFSNTPLSPNSLDIEFFSNQNVEIFNIQIDSFSAIISFSVNADCGQNENCNLEVVIVAYECDVLVMQAVNFPEDAIIHWTIDGEPAGIGAPVTFFFEDGVHHVCAFYETPDCPEGVEWCETFEFGCGNECTNTVVSIDSFVEQGGPQFIVWNLVDENGMSVGNGTAQYSGNDPYFDTMLCLEDGCYTLLLQFNAEINEENLNVGFYINGEQIEVDVQYNPGFVIFGPLGINSDCANEESCDAFFAYTNPEANFFHFENLSVPQEGATYIWNFGDGTSSDSPSPSHTFEVPGEYEVCLTVIFGECEDMYCQVITIGEEGCTDITFTLTAETIGFGLLTWELISDEFDLGGQIPIDLIPEEGLSLTFCVPDGCYSLEFEWNGIAAILWETMANQIAEQVNADVTLTVNDNNAVLVFGISTDCTEGISDISSAHLNAYPNPSSETLNLEVQLMSAIGNALLYDMAGKIVWTGNIVDGRNEINVSSLGAGIYQLLIIDQQNTYSTRIAVSR